MSQGIVKDVWLRMLRDGGYTTLTEMKEAVGEEKRVDRILQQLADQGCCVCVPDPARKVGVRYGITSACKVPREVRLEEILKAAQ